MVKAVDYTSSFIIKDYTFVTNEYCYCWDTSSSIARAIITITNSSSFINNSKMMDRIRVAIIIEKTMVINITAIYSLPSRKVEINSSLYKIFLYN